MQVESIREVMHRAPGPLEIALSDGRVLRVPHPDFIAVNPQRRQIIVVAEDSGATHHVDALHVVSATPVDPSPGSSQGSSSGSS